MNTTGQVMPNGDTVYYEDSKARDMFADAYDSTKSYAVGNHCIKDDVLYICNTAIPSGGETWNSAHWTATTFDAEVIQIKSNLDESMIYYMDSEEHVIGKRRGKTFYRKYVHKTGVQVATNTDYTVTTTGDLPSDATNITISDASFIGSGSMKLPADCMYSIFYSVGNAIKWRQGWSSSTVWEMWLWAEYEKNTET